MVSVTDLQIRSAIAQAQRERRTVEIRLGEGLELRAGLRTASFSLKFNDRRNGRRERLTLGYYPAISLSEARRRAREEQARIADPYVRANPARERRDLSAMVTFAQLAELRLAEDNIGESTREYYRWCLATHAHRTIGNMAAAEVRFEDILAIVDRIAKTSPTTADRVQTAISSVLTFGVKKRILPSNPARGIEKRAADIPRDRLLTDAELRVILRELQSPIPTASDDLKTILHLLLLTGARSSEVRLAQRYDLRWEGYSAFVGPVWVVPGDRLSKGRKVRGRTKSGRQKVLPLSTQAAALFARAIGAAGDRVGVFDVNEGRAVSYSMMRLCNRVGLMGELAATPHDFRRAISTWLADRGERGEVIEAILGHAPTGITRRHYNLSLLLPFVAQAQQRWADHLQGLCPAEISRN
jgi:integrase